MQKFSKKNNHKVSEININIELFHIQVHKFLKIKGCAMGTKYTPTYAYIFMGIFEETQIYLLIKQKVQLYLRYIDDIFFIWTGSENELKQLISKINGVHPSINFDFNYSKTQIQSSDITIKETSTGKLLKSGSHFPKKLFYIFH